jgi:hypothetical protein
MPYHPNYKQLRKNLPNYYHLYPEDSDFIWPNRKRKFDRFLRQNGYKVIDLTKYRHDYDYRRIIDSIYIKTLKFISNERYIIYYDDEIWAYSLFNKGDENQYTLWWPDVQEPFENCIKAFNPPKECAKCGGGNHLPYTCEHCGCKCCQSCMDEYKDIFKTPWAYHSWECVACKYRNLFNTFCHQF